MTTTTRPDYMAAMAVTGLPVRRSGDVAVRQFTVDKHDSDLDRIRSMFASTPSTRGRWTPPGTYTALYRNGSLWMSDTPDERRDILPFIYRCEQEEAATVLVNGLGLGAIIGGLIHVPTVEQIEVCEIDPDVIALVGEHVAQLGEDHGVVVDVHLGDAFTPNETWPKGSRWDAAWHDIWPTICADDYDEHKRIRRMYSRRVGFQEVWAADAVRAAAREDRVYGGMWV